MTILRGAGEAGRRRLAWALALATCTALGFYALSFPLNHDAGWYLYLARRILAGDRLYTDLIEVNPPLYTYLAIVPSAIARLSNVPAARILQVSILVVALGSSIWAGLLTTRLAGGRPVLVTLAFAVPLLGLAGLDLGQREHLMVALTAPYLVLAARRATGDDASRVGALAAGLAAGVGFSLKPHFVLIWLAVEAWLAARSPRGLRSPRRTEAVTVLAFFVAYAAFVLLVYPAYLNLLWHAGHLYTGFWAIDGLGLYVNRYSLLLAATVIAAWACRPATGAGVLVRLLLIVATMGLLVSVVQGKGWLYHYYPVLTWAMVAMILVVAEFCVTAWRDPAVVGPLSGFAVVVVLTVTTLSTWSLLGYQQTLRRARLDYLAVQAGFVEENHVESMVILSPSLLSGFPLVNYTEIEWAAPFPSLWWVAGAHPDYAPRAGEAPVAPVASDSVERVFLRRMVNGMESSSPDVVMVDTASITTASESPFPYIGYFSQAPGFDRFWSRYRRAGSLETFAVYQRLAQDDPDSSRASP